MCRDELCMKCDECIPNLSFFPVIKKLFHICSTHGDTPVIIHAWLFRFLLCYERPIEAEDELNIIGLSNHTHIWLNKITKRQDKILLLYKLTKNHYIYIYIYTHPHPHPHTHTWESIWSFWFWLLCESQCIPENNLMIDGYLPYLVAIIFLTIPFCVICEFPKFKFQNYWRTYIKKLISLKFLSQV